jgi:hypothetical protein
MKLFLLWLIWSLVIISVVAGGWQRIDGNIRVYGLIVVSGLYLLGIFILYGLMRQVPIW